MEREGRSGRDLAANAAALVFAACFAALSGPNLELPDDLGARTREIEQIIGGLGCAALLLRRRRPFALAVVLLLLGNVTHYLTGPVLVAVFTVAAARPAKQTAWIAAIAFAPLIPFLVRFAEAAPDRRAQALVYFALVLSAIGWGLWRRSRRLLLASLRERAELAEAGAELRAERARQEARKEIAREMHDVLGHRLSLLSLYAGALQYNEAASREEVARASGLIADNARLALTDLREVIGVLRAGPGTDERPQPCLDDLPRLVAEERAAGGRITLTVPEQGAVPASVGRAAYRIVQETLTNARKHAPGTAVEVAVSGGPGRGLAIQVANPLPPGTMTHEGHGLLGLVERARLAGGDLTAGPRGDVFQVSARLPWPEAAREPEPGTALEEEQKATPEEAR
ncbi:signal transduction histidine kinase [Actinocorallia herbida]|uniref:histidine kinase n=1 Tax=Actinocorallia herbida TaxID=58109 RepID=A0A3N1CV36_9ACTN|nr:histidine kinase [Actinocorallia herbida]ROO85137.1 signal transduction histidine kinase [Actinocorallia herbida]